MVNYKEICEKVFEVRMKVKSQIHQARVPSCGVTSSDEFLTEQEEKTDILVPELIRKILLEYGAQNLEFKILNKENPGRYIFGGGKIDVDRGFERGGFDRLGTFKDNLEYFVKIPMEGAVVLEDLKFGRYIVLRQRDNAETVEDVDLYLYGYPDDFYKLNVSFEQYFSFYPKTFGMYCWQEYLTQDDYILDGYIPDHFHKNMKKLFPDVDLSLFRPEPELKQSTYNDFVSKPDKLDYRQVFIGVMQQLENDPDVELKHYKRTEGFICDNTKYTVRYGVTEDVLRKIKHDYGREISEKMLAFYYTMNGCSVDWTYNKAGAEDLYIEGKINFLTLEETMGGKWNEQYLDWSSEDLFKDEDTVYYFNTEEAEEYPELNQLMKSARLFDEQGEMRDYFIQFVEGQEEPDIYRVIRTEFYKMDIDFTTFVEARIQFAGISGWEYRFYNDPRTSDEAKERFINDFKDKVSLILPDAPFERFGI